MYDPPLISRRKLGRTSTFQVFFVYVHLLRNSTDGRLAKTSHRGDIPIGDSIVYEGDSMFSFERRNSLHDGSNS